jgi:competence protein ComEA
MSERSTVHLAAWAIAAVLLVVAAVKLLGEERSGPAARVQVERPAAAPGGGGPRELVYVHVAGAVRHPGLYRLSSGARVADALKLAGGPARRADLAAVNLAARVEDGRQIVVPRGGGSSPAGSASAPAPGGTRAPPISLSTATAEQLDGLDGIGPMLAKRILEYRAAHGGFRSVGELRQVEGIGEKRFGALSKAVQP